MTDEEKALQQMNWVTWTCCRRLVDWSRYGLLGNISCLLARDLPIPGETSPSYS
jgi:hypothetical protein